MGKRFYKVISLFIKAILLFASFYYIFQKLTTSDAVHSFKSIPVSAVTCFCLLLVFLLMFVNWGLEARKWQLLIAAHEELSLLQALQSIMAGVTLSIFTPNRVGEFTGRIFFLKKADKFIASGKSIVGSFLQLGVTVIAGIIAIQLYILSGYNSSLPLQSLFNDKNRYTWLFFFICIFLCILCILRLSFFAKYRHDLKKIMEIKKRQLLHLFFLSFNRYLIFTLQYYLLLLAMGIELDILPAFILIAITFFITSVIPTFALTEIVVRSAVAVSVFSVLDPVQPARVAAASLLLWLVNLAIPALIGSVFIGKIQFFKAP